MLLVGGLALVCIALWASSGGETEQHPSLNAPIRSGTRADVRSQQPTLAPPGGERGESTTSASDAREAIRGPRGRVVHAATGEAVEGAEVVVRFGSRIITETVTAVDGSFQLERPDRMNRVLRIDSPEWRVLGGRIRLDKSQSTGETPIVIEVEAVALAPIYAQVVDHATGEPVPYFEVELTGPRRRSGRSANVRSRRATVVTDAEGRFATAESYAAGEYAATYSEIDRQIFEVLDEGGMETRIEHVMQRIEHKLTTQIGPTYEFDVELPGGLSLADFFVVFPSSIHHSRDAHEARATGRAPLAGLQEEDPMRTKLGDASAIYTSLRSNEAYWARFQQPISRGKSRRLRRESGARAQQWTFELQLRSLDGHWLASTIVDSVEGVHETTLPLQFDPRAVLRGTITDEVGQPIKTAWVTAETDADTADAPHEIGVDEHGAFELGWLASGECKLRIEAEHFHSWVGSVELTALEATELDTRLASEVELGSITGTVRSRSGKYCPFLGTRIALRRLDAPAQPDVRWLQYEEGAEGYLAPFDFARVPVGEYELSVEIEENWAWNHQTLIVTAPAQGLEFICEDDAEVIDLEPRPTDSRNGRAIEDHWASLWMTTGGAERELDRATSPSRFEDIPTDQPYHWIIRAKGYRLATGDESAFRLEDGLWVCSVELEPGWGQVFRFTSAPDAPLAGVELIADGELVGVSDEFGRVLLDAEYKPRSLRIKLDGWTLRWGIIDPSNESFGMGAETEVRMAPE